MADPANYSVGWICALVTEYVAARLVLDKEHPCPSGLALNDTNTYCLGSIRDHKVVIAVLPDGEYGTASAASVATNLLHSFPNVRVGLMVGIGGGAPNLPKNDIRLGDVVVSVPRNGDTGIFQYDFGKIRQDQPFQNCRILNQPPTVLRTAIAALRGEYEINGHGIEEAIEKILSGNRRLRKKYGKPPLHTDMLFESSCVHEEVCAESDDCISSTITAIGRPERDEDELLQIHYGLIASSNQLMKDATVRDRLTQEKDVPCFEMEAAGLANHFPCIAVRGICDYSDSHMNKQWQGYAALAAAAYAKDLLLQVVPSGVENEKRINDALCKVLDSSARVEKGVQDVASQIQSDQARRMLNWLSEIKSGFQQSDYLSRRAEGTGLWFLNSLEYHRWHRKAGRVLFCPGNPGSGKTVLTSVVIEDLASRYRADGTVALSFVFCNYRQEYTVVEMLASLLRQLCSYGSTLPSQMVMLYENHRPNGTRPRLSELVGVMEAVTKLYERVFVIVDAVDEWRQPSKWQGHSDLLGELLLLQQGLNINLFVTSRPLPSICTSLQNFPTLGIVAGGEDIGKYVNDNLPHLISFVDVSSELLHDIKKEIVEVSRGVFLLAYLYLRSFKDASTVRDVMLAMERIKSRRAVHQDHSETHVVDEAYDEAMRRIQTEPSGRSHLAVRVLTWISCATRPLSILELRHALATDPDKNEFDSHNLVQTNFLISVCCGLVTLDDQSDIIRLVHQTTHDYFERTRNTWFKNAQDQMAITCATYLRIASLTSDFSALHRACIDPSWPLTLRKNWDGLGPSDQSTVTPAREPVLPPKSAFTPFTWAYPFYDYSSLNWAIHLSKAEVEKTQQTCIPSLRAASRNIKAQGILGFHFGRYNTSHTTELHLAAKYGLLDCLGFLTEIIQVNHKDHVHWTPLTYAASEGHEPVVKWLLDNGAHSDGGYGSYRGTPLFAAAENGHHSIVKILLGLGVDVENRPYARGSQALHAASKNGHLNIAQALVLAGASITEPDHWGSRPLHWAAEGGNCPMIEFILDNGVEVDVRNAAGQTPLHIAARNGHGAAIRILALHGANVRNRDLKGHTSVHAAARYSNNVDVLEVLLEIGADIHATRAGTGETPLCAAAYENNFTVARWLIEKGADINYRDRTGETPLSIATQRSFTNVMELLLEAGAEVDTEHFEETSNIWTPLDHATTMDGLKLLLSYGVDIDKRSAHRPPRLIYEAQRGRLQYIKLLADHEADMNVRTDDGIPVLSLAARVLPASVVHELLNCGASIDYTDNYSRTALMCAIKSHRTVATQVLLESGASLDCEDTWGQTAMDYAHKCAKDLCCRRPFTAAEAEYYCRDLWYSRPQSMTCDLDDIHTLEFGCGLIAQLFRDTGYLDAEVDNGGVETV